MQLSDVAIIKVDFPDADFWLIRRGSISQCGKPVRVFNPEQIGIKVTRLEKLLPDYLFYSLMDIHHQRGWESLARGSLRLVNIRVNDVRGIQLAP